MTPTNGRLTTSRISTDQLFTTLSHSARRRVLAALVDGSPRDEAELESVALAPDGPSGDAVAIELHHAHLPHLDDAGFVDWDRDAGTVARGPEFGDIRPLLELLEEREEELPGSWP